MDNPVSGTSSDSKVAGVKGECTSGRGLGVSGGVRGESIKTHGVLGRCRDSGSAGVFGVAENDGDGVFGRGRRGVVGISDSFQGVFGKSTEGVGVFGESDNAHGITGICHNHLGGGVIGSSDKGGCGVIGGSDSGVGVYGESNTGVGVRGKGGRLAGLFEGDVEVTGVLKVTGVLILSGLDVDNQLRRHEIMISNGDLVLGKRIDGLEKNFSDLQKHLGLPSSYPLA